MRIMTSPHVVAVIPAAGVGSRMQADRPKQYLSLAGKTILEHTVTLLLNHPSVSRVVIAISHDDDFIHSLPIIANANIDLVEGGKTRADSVLNALASLPEESWALVHDAARPCVSHQDIDALLAVMNNSNTTGGILASPVRDTMKRACDHGQASLISHTESRENLWHALTPQLFPTGVLLRALNKALSNSVTITDEASAIEYAGGKVALINGNPANIKITHPADLPLAEFYIKQTHKVNE